MDFSALDPALLEGKQRKITIWDCEPIIGLQDDDTVLVIVVDDLTGEVKKKILMKDL